MRTGRGGIADEAGGEFAIGVDFVEVFVEVGQFEAAAAGLLEEVDLKTIALGGKEDRLAGTIGHDADAAESEPSVAIAGASAFAVPERGGAAARVEAAIAGERMSREREAGAAVAEALLEGVAEAAGKVVGGGVGVAPLDNVDGRFVFRSA
jgi:hypothetical protein